MQRNRTLSQDPAVADLVHYLKYRGATGIFIYILTQIVLVQFGKTGAQYTSAVPVCEPHCLCIHHVGRGV